VHVLTLFERRLCRRNLFMGEVSEGAVEAPSDRKRTDASRSRTKRETWPSSVTFTMRVV